ncbi:MAG: hypothetical protein AAF589_09165 [Planctomycetota bacterium]
MELAIETATPPPPAPLQRHVNYRDLTKLLVSIEKRLDGPPWADPIIPSLLESLVLHLEAHLETELGQSFRELAEEDPRLTAPIDALVRDGYEVLFRAKDLANRGRRQPRIRTTWVALGRAVRDLHAACEKQEAAERELLNEAYQRDIGARD